MKALELGAVSGGGGLASANPPHHEAVSDPQLPGYRPLAAAIADNLGQSGLSLGHAEQSGPHWDRCQAGPVTFIQNGAMVEGKRKAGPELQGLPTRLAERMAELGWSDHEVSRRTTIGRSVITRLRNGKALDGVTCHTAIILARALGVSLDWLLTGTETTKGRRSVPVSAPVVGVRLSDVPNIVEPTEDRRILEAVQRALQTLGVEAPKHARGSADPSLRSPQARSKRST